MSGDLDSLRSQEGQGGDSPPKMKAFRVWIPRFNKEMNFNTFEIVAGVKAGKVRYAKFLSLRDVLNNLHIFDVQVRRAPEYDEYASDEVEGNSLGWKESCNSCGSVQGHGIFASAYLTPPNRRRNQGSQ